MWCSRYVSIQGWRNELLKAYLLKAYLLKACLDEFMGTDWLYYEHISMRLLLPDMR